MSRPNPIEVVSDAELTAEELHIVRTIRERLPQELRYSTSGDPPRTQTEYIVWHIPRGIVFGDLHHFGPCVFSEQCLPLLENSQPTPEMLAIFIPRFMVGSRGMPPKRQLDTIQSTRDLFGLPSRLFTGFGSANAVGALMLKYFELTGERIPQDYYWALTDSIYGGDSNTGRRLMLSMVSAGLSFHSEPLPGLNAYQSVGGFPFGVLHQF